MGPRQCLPPQPEHPSLAAASSRCSLCAKRCSTKRSGALRQKLEQHLAEVSVASLTEGIRDTALDVGDGAHAGCHALFACCGECDPLGAPIAGIGCPRHVSQSFELID